MKSRCVVTYLIIHASVHIDDFRVATSCKMYTLYSTLMGNISQWSHVLSLQWRHNEHDGVSSHHHQDCLLNRLFRRRSKKTSKLRVTGLCAGKSPETGEFPAQRASNAETSSCVSRSIVHVINPNNLFNVTSSHPRLLLFNYDFGDIC